MPPVSEQKVTAPVKEAPKEIVKADDVKAETGPSLHIVKSGETLYSIARAYGLPVQTLCSVNKKSINYRLKVGERLTIPSSGHKSDSKVRKDTAGQVKILTYRVKPGDSLTSVAKKFHTTMADIKKLNNLKRNTLDKGQVLKIRTNQ